MVLYLKPGVQRDREDAPRLPLKAALDRAAVLPDFRSAVTLDDHIALFVHMLLRLERRPRRNLDDEHAGIVVCTDELDVAGLASDPGPVGPRQLPRVAYTDSLEDGDAFFIKEGLPCGGQALEVRQTVRAPPAGLFVPYRFEVFSRHADCSPPFVSSQSVRA
jgi:hypothetical protein